MWYLIWETILNVLAELTHFADRSFYDAWWNSGTQPHTSLSPHLIATTTLTMFLCCSVVGPVCA